MGTKELIVKKIEEMVRKNNNLKILDLGSGQSRNFLDLFKKYPNLFYRGIEPKKEEADVAKDLLKNFPNAKILNSLAYGNQADVIDFDVCISFSVLEHVKNLELFLSNSIKWIKPGGSIIHLYDLGHALYPSSIKEKFHVFLGNKFPKLLPERKFVNYLDEEKVKTIMINEGAEILETTYHQMPNHKKFGKVFKPKDSIQEKLVNEIYEWEFKISPFLHELDKKERELLFMSICIWARKK
jgi:2-polyprenyl-3-methyl-5-hydroxy-6-metoxy-1,4-benzoquinol methylase